MPGSRAPRSSKRGSNEQDGRYQFGFRPRQSPSQGVLHSAVPLTLQSYSGVPVRPPVELKKGETVELWWVVDAGEVRYEHAGSPKR